MTKNSQSTMLPPSTCKTRETQAVSGPARLERFPAGPWQGEPDRVEWWHEGVPCLIQREPHLGTWCGYVGVGPGHPWHGMAFEDVPADVHGGLTWACDYCSGMAPGPVWWLGFDCAHWLDLCPLVVGYRSSEWAHLTGAVYRDQAYVTEQVTGLARQVIAARGKA